MATLLLKLDEGSTRVIELKLGANKFGRAPGNDFQIEHATISAHHCDIVLSESGLTARDLDSTNGTFIDGEPIKEGVLKPGQKLQLGDVEMVVESVDVTIAIPKFEPPPPPPPPIVLTDGSLLCPNHPHALVTHQCTHCRSVMCADCVRKLRRRGGKVLTLCPECGQKVEAISNGKEPKESLLSRLRRTIRLPLLRDRTKD